MPTLVSRTRRAFVGVTVALAIGGLVATAPPAEAVSASTKYEQDVAKYTNAQRTKKKLKVLKYSSCLDSFAESQAASMAANQELVHQDLMPILTKCKLNTTGENIAMGYPSGKAATDAWMQSPGHKANILNKNYTLYGVGAAKDSDGVWWVSHVFGRKA